MLIESDGNLTYVSNFRIQIAAGALEPMPQADFRTVRALVDHLNETLDEQQRTVQDEIRNQLLQPNSDEFPAQSEQQLLSLIGQQETTLAVGLHFTEGSLIVIGTITISIVLGNPTLRVLILSIGSQVLAKVATTGIQRGLQRILERLGWRVRESIVAVLVPAVSGSVAPSGRVRPQAPGNVTLGVPITLLAVVAFLLFVIFVTMLVMGFNGHVL